jgi:hypothetical protein
MFGAQATALRSGQVQVSICHGTTPQELEEAINSALVSVSRKSRDPQLLDIRFPQSSLSTPGGAEREYLAVVIWQQA